MTFRNLSPRPYGGQLPHFGQNCRVRPRRIGNKMQQPLMLRRNLAWWPLPPRSAPRSCGPPRPKGRRNNHSAASHGRRGRSPNKRCKSKRTTLRAFEIHRSPPVAMQTAFFGQLRFFRLLYCCIELLPEFCVGDDIRRYPLP
jgi:hypothetical protein